MTFLEISHRGIICQKNKDCIVKQMCSNKKINKKFNKNFQVIIRLTRAFCLFQKMFSNGVPCPARNKTAKCPDGRNAS